MTKDSLADEQFAPITTSVGFLRAPADEVAHSALAWWERLGREARLSPLGGGLMENAGRLLPLAAGAYPRMLFVSTPSDWTAVFDCGALGGDPASFVGYMHQEMSVQGLIATWVSDSVAPLRFGAVQLHMYSPEVPGLGYLRTLDAIRDGGNRWSFSAAGIVQPFEDEVRYRARRVRDRFTVDMLETYLDALGIRFFDPSYYSGPTWFLEDLNPPLSMIQRTFAEARAYLGYE